MGDSESMASAASTAPVNERQIEPDVEQIREQLLRILKSKTFQNGPLLQKFLEFVVVNSIDGKTESLNEYAIATSVLGRRGDFDSSSDTSVRTHAYRLRTKLREYYSDEGSADSLLINIPKGHYRPAFSIQPEQPTASSETVSEDDSASARTSVETEVEDQGTGRVRLPFWLVLSGCTILVVAIFLGGTLSGRYYASEKAGLAVKSAEVDPVVATFWKSFLTDGHGPLVVYSNARFARGANNSVHHYDPQHDAPDSVLDHYTGVGEVLAVHELDKVFIPQDLAMQVTRGSLLSLDEARSGNLILVGRPAEGASVDQIVTLKYFSFEDVDVGPRKGDVEVRNIDREDGEQEFYLRNPDLPIIDDYAVVARVSGLDKKHKILLAAGTTTVGTEAAVEYLCHQETLRVLLDKLGTQTPDLNFEAILSVKIARGVPVKTDLVAFRKYPFEGN